MKINNSVGENKRCRKPSDAESRRSDNCKYPYFDETILLEHCEVNMKYIVVLCGCQLLEQFMTKKTDNLYIC